MDKFKNAFKWQRTNAKVRGIEFLFTFNEWKKWWITSGRWEERGVGKNKYCMCRFNDTGPYALWNVYCATNGKNLSDANKGKPKSSETKKKISEALIGKVNDWMLGNKNPMHTKEAKEKISAAISGSNHYRARGVLTPQGTFQTAKAAAEALNIKKPTVEWRAKNNKFGFSYLAIA